MPPWRVHGHATQALPPGAVVHQQTGLALLQAPDAGAMGAHQGAQRGRAQEPGLPDLPAQQAGGRGKGQVLRQQAGHAPAARA